VFFSARQFEKSLHVSFLFLSLVLKCLDHNTDSQVYALDSSVKPLLCKSHFHSSDGNTKLQALTSLHCHCNCVSNAALQSAPTASRR